MIPLGDLPARVHEPDRAKNPVVYCHTGVKGGRAVECLEKSGFGKARNLLRGASTPGQ